MTKIWLLARQTYRRRIRSGTFLIMTFGLPLLMIIAGAIPALSSLRGDLTPTGYVDQTGELAPVLPVIIDEETFPLSTYNNPDEAQAALRAGTIEGYLVIPADYFQGVRPVYYAEETPGPKLETALANVLQKTMLAGQPEWLGDRLSNPAQLTYIARQNGEAVAEGPDVLVQVATPMVLALGFALLVFTGASQIGPVMVEEKDQRAMEMVITSLAPWQLVAGKILGMVLLTATQLLIWLTGAGIALGLALVSAETPPITVPWEAIVWALLLGIPGYFLYAVLAAGLGIIAGDRQQARQFSNLLGFFGLVPLYLIGALINAMDSPLALSLTWFPLTAPVIALIRIALSDVPLWQLLISLIILLLSLAASIWVVTRIFRAAMLMYGKALRPKDLWRALRQA